MHIRCEKWKVNWSQSELGFCMRDIAIDAGWDGWLAGWLESDDSQSYGMCAVHCIQFTVIRFVCSIQWMEWHSRLAGLMDMDNSMSSRLHLKIVITFGVRKLMQSHIFRWLRSLNMHEWRTSTWNYANHFAISCSFCCHVEWRKNFQIIACNEFPTEWLWMRTPNGQFNRYIFRQFAIVFGLESRETIQQSFVLTYETSSGIQRSAMMRQIIS